ncbi:MAG: UDP-N-acetylmuramoyl-tripeptide--D-alanyl-D-alanine ligase, partial [Candidatus Paceibacterota bacterium]
MTFNPFTHIRYYIYLFQLENYTLSRFIPVSFKSLFHARARLRLGITWTPKLKILTAISVLAGILIVFIPFLTPSLGLFLQVLIAVLMFFFFSYFFFLLLSLFMFLALPVDRYAKRRITKKAQKKLKTLSHDLTVIGITGSYGKTTMKEVVAAALSGKFNVLKTKKSKNTPLGISRQILSELSEDIDVYVVEMGAYGRGEIKELVDLVAPEIVILVGINEAHLERQGSMENIIQTKFEIVKHAPKDTFVVLNHDDKRVRENAPRFIRNDQEVKWFGTTGGDIQASGINPQENGTISFKLKGEEDYGIFSSRFLASYIALDAAAALCVAQKLEVSVGTVKAGISQVSPAPHRLNPSELNGVLYIDDAYNGNPKGVEEALKVLQRFPDRRKIYITPGLVEMGERTEEVHTEIGRKLRRAADIVILIENEATHIIR